MSWSLEDDATKDDGKDDDDDDDRSGDELELEDDDNKLDDDEEDEDELELRDNDDDGKEDELELEDDDQRMVELLLLNGITTDTVHNESTMVPPKVGHVNVNDRFCVVRSNRNGPGPGQTEMDNSRFETEAHRRCTVRPSWSASRWRRSMREPA